MSPQQFHAKREISTGNALCPPPLKIHRDSHFIRKSSSSSSSPSSSSSSTSSLVNGVAGSAKQPRQPVIIYTHSPKVIHTHPRDFMALVQKLTGMSRSDDEPSQKATKSGDDNKSSKVAVSDDNESSSVVTDENCCSSAVEGQVNSCFAPPIFEPPPPPPPQLASSYLANIPTYRPNSTDFLCSNQPIYNYNDPFFFSAPSVPSFSSANSNVNGINDFYEYSEF